MGYGGNYVPNARPTGISGIIIGVGGYPAHMKGTVDDNDQDVVSATGASKDTEEEDALDEDGENDDNLSEGTKYEYEDIPYYETYFTTTDIQHPEDITPSMEHFPTFFRSRFIYTCFIACFIMCAMS